MSNDKKEYTFSRKLRTVSHGVAFAVPNDIYELMNDKPSGKTWIVYIREA